MSWVERLTTAFSDPPDLGFGPPTVEVPADGWVGAMRTARDDLKCGFFDFLTAVDELDSGFVMYAHLAAPAVGHSDHVLVRARLDATRPEIDCVCAVYAGAAWHERETHEMFGIEIRGHEPMEGLLLPGGFSGHPLRKDFVLASRVAKPWPGAKEPGESDHDASPSRRRTRPAGVPDPSDWGPAAL